MLHLFDFGSAYVKIGLPDCGMKQDRRKPGFTFTMWSSPSLENIFWAQLDGMARMTLDLYTSWKEEL